MGINRRALFGVVTAIGATFVRPMAHGTTEASGDVVSLIYDAASRYGVSGEYMLALATCESNLNPDAVSARLNVNGTHDCGLFQINELTWGWWLELRGMGWADASVWNAWDNADMAGWAIANGMACHWTCAYSLGWCR